MVCTRRFGQRLPGHLKVSVIVLASKCYRKTHHGMQRSIPKHKNSSYPCRDKIRKWAARKSNHRYHPRPPPLDIEEYFNDSVTPPQLEVDARHSFPSHLPHPPLRFPPSPIPLPLLRPELTPQTSQPADPTFDTPGASNSFYFGSAPSNLWDIHSETVQALIEADPDFCTSSPLVSNWTESLYYFNTVSGWDSVASISQFLVFEPSRDVGEGPSH